MIGKLLSKVMWQCNCDNRSPK